MMNLQEVFDEILEFSAVLTVLSIIAVVVVAPSAGVYGGGVALGLWAAAGWLWLRGAV